MPCVIADGVLLTKTAHWLGTKLGNGLQWQNHCLEWDLGAVAALFQLGTTYLFNLAWCLRRPGGYFPLFHTPSSGISNPALNFRLSWCPAVRNFSHHPPWEEPLWQVWKFTCHIEHPLLTLKKIATMLSLMRTYHLLHGRTLLTVFSPNQSTTKG